MTLSSLYNFLQVKVLATRVGFSGVWNTCESQGIFSDQGIFHTFVVFTLSLSIRMPNDFLSLPKLLGKM